MRVARSEASIRTIPCFMRSVSAIDSAMRLGGFAYEIPVPNGDYEVTLYFANAFVESAGPGFVLPGGGRRVDRGL